MIDFEKAKAAGRRIRGRIADGRATRFLTPGGIDDMETVLSTLDAAKAEIARLHKVIDKDTTSLDDHIASEQRALKEVARLTVELADEKELHIVTDTRRRELTALSEQKDRAMRELPERIVAFLEEEGLLLQKYSEYGDLLIDIQPKHFAEIIATAMEVAKEEGE